MDEKINRTMDAAFYENLYQGMNNKTDPYKEEEKNGCSAVGYQDISVSVPITIKAFGEAGNAKTQCLGQATITSGCRESSGKHDRECKFTVSQKLRVEVPVIFGARAEVGETTIDCGRADHEDPDCGCEE